MLGSLTAPPSLPFPPLPSLSLVDSPRRHWMITKVDHQNENLTDGLIIPMQENISCPPNASAYLH